MDCNELVLTDDGDFAKALETLAVYQAAYKRVAEVVSTKDPESLRSRVQEELLRRCEATGTDRVRPMVGGIPVGTMSVTFTKPTPETHVTEPVVYDRAALLAGIGEDFEAFLKDAVRRDIERYAVEYARETGELLDGMEWHTTVSLARRSVPKGVTLRIDEEKVVQGIEKALMEGREIDVPMLGE